MRVGPDVGLLPTPSDAAISPGVATVKRLTVALLGALLLFGVGQAGALQPVGVRPATVAHACLEDGCTVEAGAFVTCLSNDACRNAVVIACVAILGFVVGPLTANDGIVPLLTAAYNAASSATKWALDSLAGTISNAYSHAQAYFAPSAAEKAGLQNLAIAVSVAQGMDLVTPGFNWGSCGTCPAAGQYHRVAPALPDSMTVVFTSPVFSTCTGTCTLYFAPDWYNGADEPLTQDVILMSWKALSASGAIVASGATTYVVDGGLPSINYDPESSWTGMTSAPVTFTASFGLSNAGRPDISTGLAHSYYFQGWRFHLSGPGTGEAVSLYDVGHQADYALGTFLVNQTAGYWDRIGFSNTATPDPGSLGHGIGDQQIAIATGSGAAGAGLLTSLIGKTVHKDSTGQAIGATPTVTDANGAVVPIVQPTTQTAISAQTGTNTNVLSIPAAIATAITATAASVASLVNLLTNFFDLSRPIDTSSFRSNASLMSMAFPFSIPWDVARMTHLAFDVAPVTPSLTFSLCISGGHVSSSCSNPPSLSLAILDPFIGFIRWALLLMFIVGIAYGYRRLAGASV